MRIKAFTIIELAAALFIGSLLASFAYITLAHLQGSIIEFGQTNVSALDWRRTEWSILQDLDQAVQVKPANNGFQIIGPQATVSYGQQDHMLIRYAALTDTLHTSMSSYALQWASDRFMIISLIDTSGRQINLSWEADVVALKERRKNGH